jgi:thioredoxin reductase
MRVKARRTATYTPYRYIGLVLDVIVVGGSFAGLSAATQLARARRSVLVVDDAQPRNRFAAHSHGFLTQDGTPPARILALARAQLAEYPTVSFHYGRALAARKTESGFSVDAGPTFVGRRLVLTYGMRDHLPDVPGLAEAWGRGVFHCPFCHGYEVRDRPLAVLGNGDVAVHQATMIPDWSPDVILFTNGPATFAVSARVRLERRGVRVEETPVARVVSRGDLLEAVELADSRRIPRTALLTASRVEPASDLHAALGCALEEGPLGPFLRTDAMKETSVPGVYAAGDLARAAGNVPVSVGDGAWAGASAYRSLLSEDGG